MTTKEESITLMKEVYTMKIAGVLNMQEIENLQNKYMEESIQLWNFVVGRR